MRVATCSPSDAGSWTTGRGTAPSLLSSVALSWRCQREADKGRPRTVECGPGPQVSTANPSAHDGGTAV